MNIQGPAGPRAWTPRFVLVSIDDEATQAMVCVALEQSGFQPVAVLGSREAAEVAAVLPRPPLAMVASTVTAASPARASGNRRRRRGHFLRQPALPTLMLDAPLPPSPGQCRRVPPPDLAGIIRAVEALAVV